MEYSQKITAAQLKRRAVLYIRQSTMAQVYENAESTRRQYSLTEKLIQLGWPPDNIATIDCDLGQTGSGACERGGFEKLVADVINDEVGAIACLETSRLARNSREWSRLMEICSITRTVLIDADGIYNLGDFNDRLLLGLKGTMNEAELHFLRSRMRDAALSKAKRGELRIALPVGYVYNEAGRVVKDPNADVRSAVNQFFEIFRMCGSASQTARHYAKNGFKIPKDPSRGFGGAESLWVDLSSMKALDMLHNPSYAGIYAYGREQAVATFNGAKLQSKPAHEWNACIKGHHEAYISEEEFNANQARLLKNNSHTSSVPPVREGGALLQGLTICGVCWQRMTVHHQGANGRKTPYYVCAGKDRHYGGDRCQYVHGVEIDKAVSNLVLERLTPMAIENALRVQEEIKRRESASESYFALQLERVQYEVGLARKRFMSVDPSNRLVAFELETIWNQKIIELAKAEEELRIHENAKAKAAAQPDISELMAIPGNVRDIWNNENIKAIDRKRIIRCLVDDVTITKEGRAIRLGVRLKTGATAELECQSPPLVYTVQATSSEVIDIIRHESMSHTKGYIAEILNDGGYVSGKSLPFTADGVGTLMRVHKIPSLKEHLKANGYITAKEKAAELNMDYSTFHKMRGAGQLDCVFVKTSGNGDYMFAP
jgi:DNA invertase Pin-like site-specific DNA recombinase